MHSEREKVVEIRGLVKSFGENHVLRNVDLDLYKGENLVVLGKSGSGKSVLIKLMVGLLRQDEGTIKIFGIDNQKLNLKELNKLRLRIGFSFQASALYDSMTVRENLEFPLRNKLNSLSNEELDSLIKESLHDVGLDKAIKGGCGVGVTSQPNTGIS